MEWYEILIGVFSVQTIVLGILDMYISRDISRSTFSLTKSPILSIRSLFEAEIFKSVRNLMIYYFNITINEVPFTKCKNLVFP